MLRQCLFSTSSHEIIINKNRAFPLNKVRYEHLTAIKDLLFNNIAHAKRILTKFRMNNIHIIRVDHNKYFKQLYFRTINIVRIREVWTFYRIFNVNNLTTFHFHSHIHGGEFKILLRRAYVKKFLNKPIFSLKNALYFIGIGYLYRIPYCALHILILVLTL